MSRSGFIVLVLGALLSGSACSGSSLSTSGQSQVTPAPGPTAAGPALRGIEVTAFACSPEVLRASAREPIHIPLSDVTAFLLCPSPQNASAVTVHPGDEHFRSLLAVLSAPDAKPSISACPQYADLLQIILANTRTGAARVRLPVDGCGHYQHVAILIAARTH